MAISEVHHVGITVTDLDRSIDFYSRVLGFRKTLDMPLGGPSLERLMRLKPGARGRSVMMQQGDSQIGEIELIKFDPPAAVLTGQKKPGDPGLFMLSFEVRQTTLKEVCVRLTNIGVSFYSEPQSLELAGYGVIKAVMFEDPDGVIIELVQLPTKDEVEEFRKQKAR